MRKLIVAMACAGGCLAIAGSASAAPTASNVTVTSPAGTYLLDDEVTPSNTITLTGTSNGVSGDHVDLKCYGSGGMGGILTLKANVAVQTGGGFTFSGPMTGIGDSTCVLRAVPVGDTTAHPPGTASPFQGPTLAITQRSNITISGGPNGGKLYDYRLTGSQLAGGVQFSSLGDCPIYYSYVYDPVTFATGNGLFFCNAAFQWANGQSQAGFATATRSELQVDGANAYVAYSADTVGSPPNPSFGGNLSGFPSLTYTPTFDPATGNLVIDETDQVVKCSPSGAFPPTSSNCTSWVPTGVQVQLHMTAGQNGLVGTVMQRFSSTDGAPHSIDLLEDNQFYHSSSDGQLNFPWIAGGMQPFTSVGQVLPGAPSSPGSFYVKGSGAAPDGNARNPQGAVTFSTAPDRVIVIGTTNNAGLFSWFELHYSRMVPASGSVPLAFTYSDAALASTVSSQAAAAEASYRPSVSISAPPSGSSTAQNHVTVSGTASDANGTPTVTVNGVSATVGAGGSWSATVPLNPGANTITATARGNLFGNTAQAQTSVTYAPPAVAAVGGVTATANGVTVAIGCTGVLSSQTCDGDAKLTTLEHLLGSKLVSLSRKRARKPTRTVTVGQQHFTLHAGQSTKLVVPVNAIGKAMLRRFGKLPVNLTVTLNGATGKTTLTTRHLTLKANKHKNKKKKKH